MEGVGVVKKKRGGDRGNKKNVDSLIVFTC